MNRKSLSPSFLLILMLLSMISGAMALNKVSPVLNIIVSDLNLTGSAQGGLLISVFAISGIFLAIPIGAIMQKIGYYKVGIIALAAIVIGSIIGTQKISFEILLLSRIIEGIGLIILTTVGPAVVTQVYKGKKLGAAMGFLMCFMTFGQIIMLNCAPRIASAFGWKKVWLVSAIYAGIILIIWVASLRNLDSTLDISDSENTHKTNNKLFPKEVFLNWKLWFLGITFMLYLIAQQGVIAFLPSYLTNERGLSTSIAGSLVSIASFIGIPTAILSGMISDKLGTRKKIIFVLMIASSIVYAIMPFFPTSVYGIIIGAYGLTVMGIVGLCISAASELVSPEHAGMAVAFMNTMQWLGIFLSSTIFGAFVDFLGYTGAFLMLVPITIVGGILVIIIKALK